MCRGCGDKSKKLPLGSTYVGPSPSSEVTPQAVQEGATPILSPDQASWLQTSLNSLATLVAYLSALKRASVSADHEMYDSAVAGAVRGQAREIARTLGYIPGENLEPYYAYDSRKAAHI